MLRKLHIQDQSCLILKKLKGITELTTISITEGDRKGGYSTVLNPRKIG